MLHSVEGTYEEGQLRLKEPVNIHGRWRIVVTFLEPAAEEHPAPATIEDDDQVITFHSRRTDEVLREIERKKVEARDHNPAY